MKNLNEKIPKSVKQIIAIAGATYIGINASLAIGMYALERRNEERVREDFNYYKDQTDLSFNMVLPGPYFTLKLMAEGNERGKIK